MNRKGQRKLIETKTKRGLRKESRRKEKSRTSNLPMAERKDADLRRRWLGWGSSVGIPSVGFYLGEKRIKITILIQGIHVEN